MTNNQYAGLLAQAKDNKAIFVMGVIGIINQQGMVIEENILCILKGNTVLLEILPVFCVVPVKGYHTYIVLIFVKVRKGLLGAKDNFQQNTLTVN